VLGGPAIDEVRPVEVGGLVHDVPGIDEAAEPSDAVFDALHLESADRLQVVGQPSRVAHVPGQRMALAGDATAGAPAGHLLGVGVLRLAAIGLVPGPVKREGGKVQQVGEPPPVRVFQVCGQSAPLEDVRSEQEGVAGLPEVDLRPLDGLAGGVEDADRRVGLAVLLDAVGGRGQEVILAGSLGGATRRGGGRGKPLRDNQRHGGHGDGRLQEVSAVHPFVLCPWLVVLCPRLFFLCQWKTARG